MIREEQILRPQRFRFTDEADIKLYGDRWYVYDEAAIVRLPARDLIKLETALGMRLPTVMNGVRGDTALGALGASWLAVHLVDPDAAGKFEDYSPLIMFTEWEQVPAEEDGGPLDLPTSSDSSETPSTE